MAKLAVQKRIEELYQIKLGLPKDNRVEELMKLLKAYESNATPEGVLDATIIGIQILKEYQKHFALNRRVAESVIRSTTERMNFLEQVASKEILSLKATLYLILSKVEAVHGNYWNATNYRALSFEFNTKVQPGGKVNALLSEGHLYLRFGFGGAAISSFSNALALADGASKNICCLMLAKTYRLCLHWQKAEDTLVQLQSLENITDSILLELHWEKFQLKFAKTSQSKRLFNSVGADGDHRQPSYVLEAKMLSFCKKKNITKPIMPKVRSLSREKDLDFRTEGPLYKVVSALEECYDELRPIEARMEKLSQALERLDELKLIEHSQLFLVAATTWFQSQKIFPPALTCLLKYEQISYSLTGGASIDHLNISQDLRKTSWYASLTKRDNHSCAS